MSHRFLRPLVARDRHEPHRVASPLELLTDLCFVVAVAQAAAELHHAISNNHVGTGLLGFSMAFFAIWWAWMNFTWFGSAYDNDDVPYRLLTILQILGVLTLAAGIHRMFEGDFHLGVVGYLIMRVALVGQWFRAALHDEARRKTCLTYAFGIILVQICWVAFLFLPPSFRVPAFFLFLFLELLVPVIAEKFGMTPWHPHHAAERYGLFFIIVLGETILSSTLAIQGMVNENRTMYQAVFVVLGGVFIIFSVWWLYFSRNAGHALERATQSDRIHEAFCWGFGHYFIFAAGAALGAGLAARVDYWTHESQTSALTSALMVTVPVAVLLMALWAVHIRPHDSSIKTLGPFTLAAALVIGTTFTPAPEMMAGLVCALLLLVELKIEKHHPVQSH